MPLPPPRTLLELIAAEPRPAGGPAEAAARAHCRAWLEELGFTVEEREFDYSALPGRWGTPLAGLFSAAAITAVALLATAGRPGVALGLVAAAGAGASLSGRWVARHGVLDLPFLRRRSVNLIARRGSPSLWLVAHLDSKSQPVPIGVRAAGIVATAAVWCIAVMLLVAQLLGWGGEGVGAGWRVLLAAGLIAAFPVALTTVGSASPGAVDDASGVATVLHAAALSSPDQSLGVALTSGEELGLAGARAWARGTPPASALNVDGVDDDGETIAMYTGALPERVCRALDSVASAGEEHPRVRCRRLLPGILTDGVALADAGWEVVTVSRGTRRTLQRIHSSRDDLSRLRGAGVASTARVLADAAVQLGGASSAKLTGTVVGR